jgi:hypothetical protein
MPWLTRVPRCGGRGAEFETVLGLLDGTQQGQCRLLLVDIRSRADLARIALEHARPEAAQTP